MKREKILISVVVPAYNEEKLIASCLTALKNQDFPFGNYEIIVVDNVSADKTALVAQKMGIRVVFEKKKGIAFALKTGFTYAQGEIVALVDADTIVNSSWLSRIYQTFKKEPRLVVVGGRIVFRPKRILSIPVEVITNFGCWLLKFCNGANMAIKKEVYQKIGGINEKINFNWENDLSLRAKKEGKFVFLWHNPVITSSRHFKGIEGIDYSSKGLLNGISLFLFKKPVFFQFKDVRE